MAELLVLNPITSASANLMKMEISITAHSISCKPIIPRKYLYKITITRKAEATTSVMTTMKAT